MWIFATHIHIRWCLYIHTFRWMLQLRSTLIPRHLEHLVCGFKGFALNHSHLLLFIVRYISHRLWWSVGISDYDGVGSVKIKFFYSLSVNRIYCSITVSTSQFLQSLNLHLKLRMGLKSLQKNFKNLTLMLIREIKVGYC